MNKNVENLVIRNANIKNRNFAGRKDEYNAEGMRNFSLAIDDEELCNKLSEDGWNIRMKEYDDGTVVGYLKVAVSYMRKPPRIVQVTTRNGKNKLTSITEETVGDIDNLDISDIKIEIEPRYWSKGGREGIKAYLKTMYYNLVEDVFAAEYYDNEDFGEPSELQF